MLKLKEIRIYQGYTQQEVANKLNLSIQAYSHYETGRREPNYDTLKKLANFFNVSIDYLLSINNIETTKSNINENLINLINLAQGERTLNQFAMHIDLSPATVSLIKNGKRNPSAKTLLKISKNARNNVTYEELMKAAGFLKDVNIEQPKKKGIRIPVLGTIPAGIPIEAIEDILDYEEISEDMAKKGEYFALKVKGDSMLPTIKDGDIVIVKQQDDAESGKICVVMINGFDATLKEIKKDPDNQGLWVLPHNPNSDFKPTFFTNKEIIDTPVRIIGVAVEIRRSI